MVIAFIFVRVHSDGKHVVCNTSKTLLGITKGNQTYVTRSEKTVHLLFFKTRYKVTLAKKLIPNLNNFWSRNGISVL